MRVEPNHKRRDAERPDASGLGVALQCRGWNESAIGRGRAAARETHLLHARNVLGNVLDADRVLDRKAVGLALDARLVDQNPAVRSEAWQAMEQQHSVSISPARLARVGPNPPTRKRHADMVVEQRDLAHSTRVLQLQRRLLLDTKNDDACAADADLRGGRGTRERRTEEDTL